MSGPTRRPSCLAWGGLAKGNQSCNKPKQVSFLERKSIKVTGWARVFRGLGPKAWGRGLQGLGGGASRALARACMGLGPRSSFFVVLKKSLGGRQAKGLETAETAAAEVGAWREAGTGYPYPPPPPPA